MTLEEAIKHAEEVAAVSCDECREEHEQLAAWLKELQNIKKNSIVIPNDSGAWNAAQIIINATHKVKDRRFYTQDRTVIEDVYDREEIRAIGKHLINYSDTEEELSEAYKTY